jgi:hypothetical protein
MMDPFWALIAFLAASALAAGLFLAPRLRDALALEGPISPATVLALLDLLDDPALADREGVPELRDLLQRRPTDVRRARAAWKARSSSWGPPGEAVAARLDDL